MEGGAVIISIFAEEETEAQRRRGAGPGSHSQKAVEQDTSPRSVIVGVRVKRGDQCGCTGNVFIGIIMLSNCPSLHNFQEPLAPTVDSYCRGFADARIQSEWDNISPFSQFKESRMRSGNNHLGAVKAETTAEQH